MGVLLFSKVRHWSRTAVYMYGYSRRSAKGYDLQEGTRGWMLIHIHTAPILVSRPMSRSWSLRTDNDLGLRD